MPQIDTQKAVQNILYWLGQCLAERDGLDGPDPYNATYSMLLNKMATHFGIPEPIVGLKGELDLLEKTTHLRSHVEGHVVNELISIFFQDQRFRLPVRQEGLST